MTIKFEKNAGIALIIFTLLMLFTMVLHPAGGSFAYLLKMTAMIIVTHVIAIISLPFATIGFWGLTKKLGLDNFFSLTAFVFVLFGLMAVLLAGSANGLVLPIFIEKYKDATPEFIESLKPILKYNSAVNAAFDYIYTGAFCLSMLFWSIAILYTKKFPAWIAYLGILLSIVPALLLFFGFAPAHLQGFRFFVSSIIVWVIIVGITLIRQPATV